MSTIKGLLLKDLLTNGGISQAEVARAVAISHSAVWNIVNLDTWPKQRDQTELQISIIDFLVSKGLDARVLNELLTPQPRVTSIAEKKDKPMLLRRQTLTQEARKAFGLLTNPFAADVQKVDDLYLSPDIRYVRESVYHTAKHGGLIAVVGESGSGKSTLRRDLLDRIQREKLNIITFEPYVLATEDNDVKGKTLKSAHIAETILRCLAPLTNAKRSPEGRFSQIHELLRESSRAGNAHVLIIEEAHSLPLPTLKHLKRFFELEDGYRKLLGIILIGQNELAIKLSEQNVEVREVVQRCEVVTLDPLNHNNLGDYLAHRCQAFNIDVNKLITADGIDALADRLTIRGKGHQPNQSLLYPLAVGNLITGALNLAAELGVPIVNEDVVRSV
jgi:type II secretory pathway predicted ATPase ExeA